jgi:hypothetical protein
VGEKGVVRKGNCGIKQIIPMTKDTYELTEIVERRL